MRMTSERCCLDCWETSRAPMEYALVEGQAIGHRNSD
jgi:hypothetical protein